MGFSYFSERVIAEPHIVNKKLSPTTFLCPYAKKINQTNQRINTIALGTWADIKKQKNENSKLRQATEPIDNHGGNMYALA